MKSFETDQEDVEEFELAPTYNPYVTSNSFFYGSSKPKTIYDDVANLHSQLAVVRGEDEEIKEGEKRVKVRDFLDKVWKRDIDGEGKKEKLFKEGEKFDIDRVLNPPDSFLHSLRVNVEDRAYDDAMKKVQIDERIERENDERDLNINHNDH